MRAAGERHYATTLPRAAVGLLAGIAAGGLIWAVCAGVLSLLISLTGGWDAQRVFEQTFTGLLSGSFFYGVGLIFVGLPAWLVAHSYGRSGARDAIAIGAVLNFVVAALLSLPVLLTGLWPILPVILALPGPAVGFVIWRVAYRRVEAPR